MAKRLIVGFGILLICYGIFVFWYVEAGNFNDTNVCGTYEFSNSELKSVLILQSDHTFSEESSFSASKERVAGTWRLFPSDSQNRIALDGGRIPLTAQNKPRESGITYGELGNQFSLRSIKMPSGSTSVTYRKNWFR